MLRKIFIIILLLTATVVSNAAEWSIQGYIVDSISGQPVAYATIQAKSVRSKTLSDAKGFFRISLPRQPKSLEVRAMGYTPTTYNVGNAIPDSLYIYMHSSGIELSEISVRPRKEHYSKRNNPAVDFVKKISGMGEATDPMRNDYYSYDGYERITLALNNMSDSARLFNGMPELRQYLDTSEVSGKQILNIMVKEKGFDSHFRRTPRDEKTYVTGISRRGVDETFNTESIQQFLEDVLREVDVYKKDINILQNRFVSPLAPIGPDFYKYYLSDTVRVDNQDFVVLAFVPRSSESFGFTGKLYVAKDDSTMFIRRVEMSVPHNINLNFISKLYLNQEYDKAPDGSRLKTRDDMVCEISVLGQGFYARRNTAYNNHSFRNVDDSLFDGLAKIEETPGAEYRTEDYWEYHRLIPISQSESSMGKMMTTLRENKLYYWSEKILKALFQGYIPTGNPSKFDIGPINTTISGNTLEGVRLRLSGMTTAALSPRLFAKGYVAYGTRDRKWKYEGQLEYSFRNKKVHPCEFPIHSINFTSLYDVDQLGQHYLFTNQDNFVLAIKRKENKLMTYHRVNKLTYTLELENNFSVVASAALERQEATRFMPFVDGYGVAKPHYDEMGFTIQLRYAPGEKFFQQRTKRIPINLDAPVFAISHTFAPRGLFGSTFTINKTEIHMSKRFWFSAFGYADVVVKGGHVWSRVPYPQLLIPNANLSYTIQPESFATMNPMEFINDSYAQWDVTYWANGLILNRIPLIKKLKLREVVGFRGLFGHLSSKNDPALNPDLFAFPADAMTQRMTSEPYMEISAGLDNIFKVLRLDYVWRLTYRNNPGACLGGLRLAVHVTF